LENDKIKQTARSEKAGISQPEIFSVCCKKHSKYRKYNLPEELVHAILLGNITALSRAITLVEIQIQLI
jgi:LAO/AO transport system kinase